jgi:hypothetical protein
MNKLKTLLGDCAKKGIIVAVDGRMYNKLKNTPSNRQSARISIQAFNAHNDKLGFNFSNNTRQYVTTSSQHFASSFYQGFCTQAAQFYTNAGNDATA